MSINYAAPLSMDVEGADPPTPPAGKAYLYPTSQGFFLLDSGGIPERVGPFVEGLLGEHLKYWRYFTPSRQLICGCVGNTMNVQHRGIMLSGDDGSGVIRPIFIYRSPATYSMDYTASIDTGAASAIHDVYICADPDGTNDEIYIVHEAAAFNPPRPMYGLVSHLFRAAPAATACHEFGQTNETVLLYAFHNIVVSQSNTAYQTVDLTGLVPSGDACEHYIVEFDMQPPASVTTEGGIYLGQSALGSNVDTRFSVTPGITGGAGRLIQSVEVPTYHNVQSFRYRIENADWTVSLRLRGWRYG